jgi:hypothetical protein
MPHRKPSGNWAVGCADGVESGRMPCGESNVDAFACASMAPLAAAIELPRNFLRSMPAPVCRSMLRSHAVRILSGSAGTLSVKLLVNKFLRFIGTRRYADRPIFIDRSLVPESSANSTIGAFNLGGFTLKA